MNKLCGKMKNITAAARSRRGAASALIILLLVLLVFFGVLSLVTAAADLRLSEKRASWAREFYMADTLAESVYAQINDFLKQAAPDNPETGQLAAILEEYLDRADYIAGSKIEVTETGIYISLLAAADPEQGQGIDMLLHYTGKELAIIEWVQWQAPLQAPPDREDIWGGE